ncbi:predicted protein [Arabidopsis lyrata subsp. lyrata]|uniref:Predicted protein n=1 Tax=Arabidopsis lyrata subsp. lyrata TaxID=81972 RepID=D7L1P2_ARALL|nr:predicted protein [Arabidopsis lyrata subsp. lyrata]
MVSKGRPSSRSRNHIHQNLLMQGKNHFFYPVKSHTFHSPQQPFELSFLLYQTSCQSTSTMK